MIFPMIFSTKNRKRARKTSAAAWKNKIIKSKPEVQRKLLQKIKQNLAKPENQPLRSANRINIKRVSSNITQIQARSADEREERRRKRSQSEEKKRGGRRASGGVAQGEENYDPAAKRPKFRFFFFFFFFL